MEMEMHLQEFQSAQTSMTSGSVSGLDLISFSGSTRSTPPSLSPGSPHSSSSSLSHSSTVPFPSPTPLQEQLQAEQSCIITIAVAPAIPGACPAPPVYLTKEEALKSIKESIPHSRMYAQLLTSESNYQKEASSYKKAVRRQSKDIYVVVSMYAVLQGAIFTAVAQGSIFTCADRWGPVSLVCFFTIGTVYAVLDKLRYMGKMSQEVKKFERRQCAVHDKIMLLYWKGSLCEIEALEPSHSVLFKDDAGRRCIFSARGLLVLGFLLGFSVLMIASCMLMLQCPPCRCHR